MEIENKLKNISVRIRSIREALGLTQKQLAKPLKISGPTLSEFENGKLLPNFEFIYNIYLEFNVSLYYLLYGEGEMFEDRGGPLSKRLELLSKANEDVDRFLNYFDKSTVVRYFLLSQFKTKMLSEGSIIDKELEENKLKEKK